MLFYGYRFATENPNGACQPCHQERVANAEARTRHKVGTPGGNCIDCHMPKTRFANMNRSAHSMLPPTPAVTLKNCSPNACTLCHKDKSASWADAKVRQWHKTDYQRPVLERPALVDAARKRQWEKLPAMLAYIQDPAQPPSGEQIQHSQRRCDTGRRRHPVDWHFVHLHSAEGACMIWHSCVEAFEPFTFVPASAAV